MGKGKKSHNLNLRSTNAVLLLEVSSLGLLIRSEQKKKLISKQLNELATCNVPIAFHRNASKYTE